MHKLNILVHGPLSFFMTLIELKHHLKFNISETSGDLYDKSLKDADVLIFHEQSSKDTKNKINFDNISCIKILATSKNKKDKIFEDVLKLPTTIKEINNIVERSVAKKSFNKNSSINIKNYLLDKNEKKLSKNRTFILLTEKEIQLIEILLKSQKAVSKKKFLSLVWRYSSDADTHTVETHIYRLRKKILEKFSDNEFIINQKDGYRF